MITQETFWNIHRLSQVENLSAGQIATRLSLSETTVRRWLAEAGYRPRRTREEGSVLDPYKAQVDQLLRKHDYTSMQLMQQIAELGYDGSYSTLQRYVNEVRPPRKTAYLELSFDPGEAAQVDFGCCGHIPCGQYKRRLSVFVMVLCHSRMLYAEFIPCERLEHFLACHRNAFETFGGLPQRVIVDNCKCAVLRHSPYGVVKFNPRYADFAGHYGFEPVACNPRSPNEKGRVENAVGYIKKNLMPGRTFTSLEAANAALREWLDKVANVRLHGTTKKRPVDIFDAVERPVLQPLPVRPFDCSVVHMRRADVRCRFSFDGNSYSVPEPCAGQRLTVKASADRVLVYDRESLVARHVRSYDRNQSIVDPDHAEGIRKQRRRAREQNLMRDFLALGGVAESFLKGLEHRQISPRTHLRHIMTLVEMHGREAVVEALTDALEFNAFRAEYVAHLVTLRSRPDSPSGGTLHVPRAGDLLDLRVDEPDMDQYGI